MTTVLMIPVYFALCAAHRKSYFVYALLATIIYFVGAAVFICNNTALAMLDLSFKFAGANSQDYKMALIGAGEAMLAKGAHGSYGAFPGFFLLSIGTLGMSYAMLKGKIFSRLTALLGMGGGLLLLIYLILVTFMPDIKRVAMVVAAPGGLLALAWMIMFTINLYKLDS